MKFFKIIFLVIGMVLLGLIVIETDLNEALRLVGQVGYGFLLILALYFAAFLLDTITWQMTVLSAPMKVKWYGHFFRVRLAGEAFNNILPAASMGGEPIKALLLKSLYGIGYREGVASLILAKTINSAALVAFLSAGFILILGSDALNQTYKSVAGLGLAAFALGIYLFYAIQRYKISTRLGGLLSRNKFFEGLNGVLHHLEDMDDRLARFYTEHKSRFAGALVLAIANWVLGVVEVYYTMMFLGHPVSFTDAWIIETAAQLVRAGTFFIPASIGAQEGAFLVIGTAITGSPALGIAAAIVRRVREIIWVAWGLVMFYLLKPEGSLSDLTSNSDR